MLDKLENPQISSNDINKIKYSETSVIRHPIIRHFLLTVMVAGHC
jgi:hypothetical protein